MTHTHPTEQKERIVAIDVLRGFALLGILMVNIQSFALIGIKYMNPMALGPLEGSSYVCWWFSYVLFDSKFMTLFSTLFGAGIVLMWERAKAQDRPFTWLHYRRMFWLLIFGLAHAHLLWFGDILFLYGLCGMVVYWLCGLSSRWLIPLGLVLLTIGSSLSLLVGTTVPHWEDAQRQEMIDNWEPSAETVQQELDAYRGSWLDQAPHRSGSALFMETFLVGFWGFWRAGGLMLIGMALFKSGVLTAKRSMKFYTVGAVIGGTVGIAIVQYGIYRFELEKWSFEYSFFTGNQLNYWGSLFLSFAYACTIMLICKTGVLGWLRRSLASVGQMALTNYLMQTILCTTIFYGHGFGQFGSWSRLNLLGLVIGIWVFQLIVSPIWLSRFRFGPFEWLWRSLSYWKIQPLRR